MNIEGLRITNFASFAVCVQGTSSGPGLSRVVDTIAIEFNNDDTTWSQEKVAGWLHIERSEALRLRDILNEQFEF